MNDSNRYEPPQAEVEPKGESPLLTALKWILLALIAAQTIVYAITVPTFLEQTHIAMISGLHFLSMAIVAVLILVGGALLFAKSRGAIYVFGAAALIGFAAITGHAFFIQYTGVGLSVAATIASVFLTRRS